MMLMCCPNRPFPLPPQPLLSRSKYDYEECNNIAFNPLSLHHARAGYAWFRATTWNQCCTCAAFFKWDPASAVFVRHFQLLAASKKGPKRRQFFYKEQLVFVLFSVTYNLDFGSLAAGMSGSRASMRFYCISRLRVGCAFMRPPMQCHLYTIASLSFLSSMFLWLLF